MGKTKTAVISAISEDKTSGKDKYLLKQQKRKEKEQEQPKKKASVAKVGLKGGERIKVVASEPLLLKKDELKEDKKKAAQKKEKGKKYKAAKRKIDPAKFYPVQEAVRLLKETSYSSFNGSVELHIVVKDTGISENVTLPHSAGKSKKIEVADENTIEKLKKGKIDFDILLATLDMMPKLVPFAKILGPKGLMPNPKNKTVIKDKKEAKNFSLNTISVKTEKKAPLIHTVVGKVNQPENELVENIKTVISAISQKKISKAVLSATMAPGIKLQIT